MMIFNGLVKDLWRSTVCVDVLDCALVSTVVVVRFWAPCAVFNPVNTGSAPPPAWRNRICNQHPSVSGYHSSPGHVSMETDRRTSEGGRERGSPVCFCGTMSKMCRWNENHLHLVWILIQSEWFSAHQGEAAMRLKHVKGKQLKERRFRSIKVFCLRFVY